MKESKADLRKSLDRGLKIMQRHRDTSLNKVIMTTNKKVKKHIDTSINNAIKSIHENVEKDIGQQVDHFDNIILQNQVSTFGVYNIFLNKSATQKVSVASLDEGMVVGPQPHYEGPPTVPSVFGRLIDPIGEQQADVPVPNPTVGGTAGTTVSQVGVTDPNRGEAPFSAVFRPPELVEGAVSSPETKGPDMYVTRRSDAGDRISGSLGRAQNAEPRNPDPVLLLLGPVSTVQLPEFARVVYLHMVRVGSPGLGLRRRLFDPGGEALVYDPGGFRYFLGENKNLRFEFYSWMGV